MTNWTRRAVVCAYRLLFLVRGPCSPTALIIATSITHDCVEGTALDERTAARGYRGSHLGARCQGWG